MDRWTAEGHVRVFLGSGDGVAPAGVRGRYKRRARALRAVDVDGVRIEVPHRCETMTRRIAAFGWGA